MRLDHFGCKVAYSKRSMKIIAVVVFTTFCIGIFLAIFYAKSDGKVQIQRFCLTVVRKLKYIFDWTLMLRFLIYPSQVLVEILCLRTINARLDVLTWQKMAIVIGVGKVFANQMPLDMFIKIARNHVTIAVTTKWILFICI